MEREMVPPNPDWFNPSSFYCLPPHNSLLYSAMTKIVLVPQKRVADENLQMKTIDVKAKILGFSPAPDWETTKRLAVIDADLFVTVLDFQTGKAVNGHKAHVTGEIRDKSKKTTTAIVFLQQNAVISTVRSTLVHFNLNTNKFTFYHEFIKSSNPFSILRQSPKDPNLLAGGTKDGTVVVIDLEKMQITRRFRGHDKEISSIDWRYFSMPKKESEAESLAHLISSIDATDAFDVYDQPNVEEFGVYGGATVASKSDDKEDNNRSLHEKLANDEGFDYSEACRSVRCDMEASQGKAKRDKFGNPVFDCDCDDDMKERQTYEDIRARFAYLNPNEGASDSESLLSNAPSSTPDLTEESLNEAVSQSQREAANKSLNDGNKSINDADGQSLNGDDGQTMNGVANQSQVKNEKEEEEEIVLLATAAHEHQALFWDVKSESLDSIGEIRWSSKSKSPFPEAYANIIFMSDDKILISNGFGEIQEHKIELDVKERKVNISEKKINHYNAKAVLSLAKSEAGDVLWTSSIFRNISCFDVPNDQARIITLDTMQPTITCLRESHYDPNIVAITGSDKRICLWNTSDMNYNNLTLRPFMMKVQSTILCAAWHPDEEQTLAFCTRDGQVAVLDTGKPNSTPKFLKNFTNSPVYQVAWAKIRDKPILLCTRAKDPMIYFTFTGLTGKPDIKYHEVEKVKDVSSLAVSGNLLVAGTNKGELIVLKLDNQFEKVDRMRLAENKYIGMMTWFDDRLAVAQQSDVYLIDDIKKYTEVWSKNKDPKIKVEVICHNSMSLLNTSHGPRVNSVRFNAKGNLLMSSCTGGLVQILNIDTERNKEEVLANISLGAPIYTAIFVPSNEDLIICGGGDTTPLTFRWKDYSSRLAVTQPVKKDGPIKGLVWATQTDYAVKNNHKMKVKVNDTTKALENMRLADAKDLNPEQVQTPPESPQKKPGQAKKLLTIFDHIHAEIFSGCLNLVQSMLKFKNTHSKAAVEKIFQFGREEIIKMLEEDREKTLAEKTNKNIICAQLQDNLKADILSRTTLGTLTETHVAVSPQISYAFWQKTCRAYAMQCILNDDPMSAAPYFLAICENDTLIDKLCEKKFFHVAYIIAKMRNLEVRQDQPEAEDASPEKPQGSPKKSSSNKKKPSIGKQKPKENPMLPVIVDRWTTYLLSSGQYEAAATIFTCFKKYAEAIAALQRRRDPDALLLKCIVLLEDKIRDLDAIEKDKIPDKEAAGPSNAKS